MIERKNRLKKNGGFTLAELLVALLITGILLAAVSSVLLMSQKLYTRSENISYKQKSITNIETDLQNALATAIAVKTDNNIPNDKGNYYSLGFNSNGDCVEVINGVEYKTDQITEIVLKNNGKTMNYDLLPKNSMSVLKGGIVMNNITSILIDATLNAEQEKYLIILGV